VVLGDKNPYELRWMGLEEGVSKQILLSQQFDTPFILGIADDGQRIAVLSNAASANHSILTILRPDGSMLRRLEIHIPDQVFMTAIGNLRFLPCGSM
jgi:hypothetical protein